METRMTLAPRSRSLRLATVTVLFTFGCATVRAPVTTIPEVIPVHGGRVDPQLALWVEGGDAPTAAEQQAAAQRAQAALAEAAQGLEVPGDGLLVVRAQGVTRTSDRRGKQVAGGVGIALALVVVVVVAILVLASSKGGGKSTAPKAKPSSAPAPSRAAATPARAAPTPRVGGGGAVIRPVPSMPVPSPGGIRPAPRPSVHPSARPAPPPGYAPLVPNEGVVVWGDPWVNWGFYVDLTPPPPTPPMPYVVQGVPQPVGSYVLAPAAAEEPSYAEVEVEPGPPELTELRLGPPPVLPLEERGFFAGDDLMVELVVVDRVTGEPRMRKLARKDADPTDVAEVRKFLREVIASKDGWETFSPAVDVTPPVAPSPEPSPEAPPEP
jgi:hypothetical protein